MGGDLQAPPRQSMGPPWSGAGVGVGMLRGAGDSLTSNKKFEVVYVSGYVSKNTRKSWNNFRKILSFHTDKAN